jgi:hypothetical protein
MASSLKKGLKSKGRAAGLLGAVVKAIVALALVKPNTLIWFFAMFSGE